SIPTRDISMTDPHAHNSYQDFLFRRLRYDNLFNDKWLCRGTNDRGRTFHVGSPGRPGARVQQLHNGADQLSKGLVLVVRRISEPGVEPRAVIQNAAGVRVGAEAPLAVVLAHSRVADAAEGQVVNDRLDGALVDSRISRCRRVQDLLYDVFI